MGQLAKASQKIGSLFQTDLNDDGFDDDIHEVSTEVRDPDNGNNGTIITADCPVMWSVAMIQ